MSASNRFRGLILTSKPCETAERLAEEFSKDLKNCRVFKIDGESQVTGDFKRPITGREIAERAQKALED